MIPVHPNTIPRVRPLLARAGAALALFRFLISPGPVLGADSMTSPEKEKEALLITLGVISGQGLMLTCTSIATLADAYVEDVYTPEQAAEMAAGYLTMTDSVRQSLTFLRDSGMLEQEDAEMLNQILVAYEFLHKEIEAFSYFVETGDPKWVEEYEFNRDKAWEAIEDIGQ